MDDITTAVKGRHGNAKLYFLLLELMFSFLTPFLSLFYSVFSTFSPPFSARYSPFSLTFQPHYTASERTSGQRLLEMVHLLKMSLIPSTRFHWFHSEWRRTTTSLEKNSKLSGGIKRLKISYLFFSYIGLIEWVGPHQFIQFYLPHVNFYQRGNNRQFRPQNVSSEKTT